MLEGIDVSNFQPSVDWQAVKGAGIAFAFVKRSEGTGYLDPMFGQHWARAKLAGLVTGAYHFARPDLNTPQQEAAYFCSQLPPLEAGDIAILDLETEATGVDLNAWALAWCKQVQGLLGFPPLLYSYTNFINAHLNDPALGAYPLWLADYGTLPASIGPWKEVAIWQYTDKGVVPGIGGNVDRSKLSRDLAGLQALGKPAHTIKARCGLKRVAGHSSEAIAYLAAGEAVTPTGNSETWIEVRTAAGLTGWVLPGNVS